MINDCHELRRESVHIETLDAKSAAAMLYMSKGKLCEMARDGKICGAAKIGKGWVFIKEDLLRTVRECSPSRGNLWQSKKGMVIGMPSSPSKVQAEYAKVLDLKQHQKINKQRKNGTIRSRQNYGGA